MTLRKKILLSSILMVVLPLLLILVFWTGYLAFNKGESLKPINRSSFGSDRLTEAMNVLYTYEAELSAMNWDMVNFQTGQGRELLVSPDKERIEEMESLGYHIELASSKGVAYSNMNDRDRQILADMAPLADGAVCWSGNNLAVRDSFQVAGQTLHLTAVYNGIRVDQGVRDSLIPMYMVSPTLILVFLLLALGAVAITVIVISRWLGKSVLQPLEELKKGADMVAQDKLDYRISYAGRDEFGDVCQEFDHMRLQLKEARMRQEAYEEERRDLLRGISHDLRSPLTSIKGYAMGLKDGIADTEDKKQRYYDAILTRADDLERMTESLTLLVRLESDSSLLQLEKVCLDEYIRQLLMEKEAWFMDRQVDVDYRTGFAAAEVRIDIREMQRVFINLFENTVRYRIKDHSGVEIHCTRNGNMVDISFRDDGPGVRRKHLSHLFESFYRADEARTNPGKGSGIGLAVVKRIIEGQGGRVRASSDKGLCITMSLPLVNG